MNKPKVYLVTRPKIDLDAVRRLVADWGWCDQEKVPSEGTDAEQAVEVAGRLCYLSFGRGRKTVAEYIGNLLRQGHGSVLEHAVWGFVFAGVSRSCTHELVRHRAGWSYSQTSQRYVDHSGVHFVLPVAVDRDQEAKSLALRAFNEAKQAYERLCEVLQRSMPEGLSRTEAVKWVRQAARCVLPNATVTWIYATANARAWRHFLVLRGSRHAEPEIRALAVEVWRVLRHEAPAIFWDFEQVELPDGTFALRSEYGSV